MRKIDNLAKLYKFQDKDNEVEVFNITKPKYRSETLIKQTVEEFKNYFIKKVKCEANDKQIEFAEKVATIIFSEQTNDKISVIAAMCGFGKSTIIKCAMKVLCKNLWIGFGGVREGALIISPKIDTLEDIQNYIGKEYAYVIKAVDDETLTKKEKKDLMILQQAEQRNFPILLITAKRAEMLDSDIRNYAIWEKDGQEYKRTIRLMDEKPAIVNIQNVDIEYINEIINRVDKLNIDDEDKTFMLNSFNKIVKDFTDITDGYKKNNLWIHVADKENLTDNDTKLTNLCNENLTEEINMKYKTIRKILVEQGALYINEKDNTEEQNRDVKRYLKSLGVNNLKCESFKTLIFDATSKFCVEYSDTDLFQFIKIDDDRDYSNVNIRNYNVNLSKSALTNDEGKKLEITASFLKKEYKGKKNIFLVTHKDIKYRLERLLNNELDYIPKINNKNNKSEIPHFGATRGDNLWGKSVEMIHLSFNRLRDVEYIALFLSLYIDLNKMFQRCKEEKFIELLVDGLKMAKGNFRNNESLQRVMILKLLEDFEQEIFRTKLRDFNSRDEVKIAVFGMLPDMNDRVENRFGITVKEKDTPVEFAEYKIENRSNGDKGIILKNFINDKWENGEILKIKDIALKTGLTTKDIDNLKSRNKYFRNIFKKFKTDKNGTFKKVA